MRLSAHQQNLLKSSFKLTLTGPGALYSFPLLCMVPGPFPIYPQSVSSSAPEDSYGLVLVTDSGDGRPPTEEVLPRELTVNSNRFREIRRSWAISILKQMSAQCVRANAAASKVPMFLDKDFWFRTTSVVHAGQRGVRVKLVDLSRYVD